MCTPDQCALAIKKVIKTKSQVPAVSWADFKEAEIIREIEFGSKIYHNTTEIDQFSGKKLLKLYR